MMRGVRIFFFLMLSSILIMSRSYIGFDGSVNMSMIEFSFSINDSEVAYNEIEVLVNNQETKIIEESGKRYIDLSVFNSDHIKKINISVLYESKTYNFENVMVSKINCLKLSYIGKFYKGDYAVENYRDSIKKRFCRVLKVSFCDGTYMISRYKIK